MKSRKFIAGLLLALLAIGPAWAGSMMLLGAGKVGTTASPITIPVVSQSGVSSGPSNTSASYGAFFGSQNATFSTISTVVGRTVIGAPGTISNLQVALPTTVSAGTWTISLVKNSNAATALTCSISSGTTCSDATHSVTVAAGDWVAWKYDPGGTTPTAQASVQVSAQFVGTNNNESILSSGSNGNFSNSAANYVGVGGITSGALATTEANASTVVPTGGTIDNMYALGFGTVGSSPGYVLTLYKNGTATALHCTITTTTPCNDTSGADAVTVSAGDTISVQGCPGTHSGAGGSCTTSGPPTATVMYFGFRWTPTIAGEWPMMANSPVASPSNVSANYYGVNGGSNNAITTEANAQGIAPLNFTVKKVYFSVATAPGGAGSRTLLFRSNAANVGTPGNVTNCTLTTGTTCQDTTNSYSVPAGNSIDWVTTPSGTPAGTLGWRVGAVVTVP